MVPYTNTAFILIKVMGNSFQFNTINAKVECYIDQKKSIMIFQ